jgi:hypothetical protein
MVQGTAGRAGGHLLTVRVIEGDLGHGQSGINAGQQRHTASRLPARAASGKRRADSGTSSRSMMC